MIQLIGFRQGTRHGKNEAGAAKTGGFDCSLYETATRSPIVLANPKWKLTINNAKRSTWHNTCASILLTGPVSGCLRLLP